MCHFTDATRNFNQTSAVKVSKDSAAVLVTKSAAGVACRGELEESVMHR